MQFGMLSQVVPATMHQMVVHIGATWRIRLNRLCAAAMQPHAKFLSPLVMVALCNRADHNIFIL